MIYLLVGVSLTLNIILLMAVGNVIARVEKIEILLGADGISNIVRLFARKIDATIDKKVSEKLRGEIH
jgi:hypothetical protein